jgi:hypothetical protein
MRATLITDGSSDVVLLPILRWLLDQLAVVPMDVQWADLRALPRPPKTLTDRARVAMELYPCALLFVHRDAEGEPIERRLAEIEVAGAEVGPCVAVVPVRMQEAWLLHHEAALRQAAGRPSGREPLDLPSWVRIESLPDPKAVLHQALRVASGHHGRRLRSFDPARVAHYLADLIDDWSPLRRLGAFQRLERDMRAALIRLGVGLRFPDA